MNIFKYFEYYKLAVEILTPYLNEGHSSPNLVYEDILKTFEYFEIFLVFKIAAYLQDYGRQVKQSITAAIDQGMFWTKQKVEHY